MSENIETPAQKHSFLTTAMLNVRNKTTRVTVPNEDANLPKKTMKPVVAFGIGVLAGAVAIAAAVKVTIASANEAIEIASDDVEIDD